MEKKIRFINAKRFYRTNTTIMILNVAYTVLNCIESNRGYVITVRES